MVPDCDLGVAAVAVIVMSREHLVRSLHCLEFEFRRRDNSQQLTWWQKKIENRKLVE